MPPMFSCVKNKHPISYHWRYGGGNDVVCFWYIVFTLYFFSLIPSSIPPEQIRLTEPHDENAKGNRRKPQEYLFKLLGWGSSNDAENRVLVMPFQKTRKPVEGLFNAYLALATSHRHVDEPSGVLVALLSTALGGLLLLLRLDLFCEYVPVST